MKTAKQLLIEGLKAMGADGLCNCEGDPFCGCGLDDLAPCEASCGGGISLDGCRPAKRDGKYNFYPMVEFIAEVEANRALIERTAKNFLALEPGLSWEGGIDAAMKAAVAVAERLRSQLEESQIKYGVDIASTDLHWQDEIAAKDARIKELSDLNESLVENGNDLRTRCQKAETRIKELEAALNKIVSVEAAISAERYVQRLEAAFLDSLAARLYYEHYPGVSDAYSWHDYPEEACHSMPKEEFRKKAHEALARIKEGGKDER